MTSLNAPSAALKGKSPVPSDANTLVIHNDHQFQVAHLGPSEQQGHGASRVPFPIYNSNAAKERAEKVKSLTQNHVSLSFRCQGFFLRHHLVSTC